MRRLLSSLFALWFAVVLGDPGVLHSCAMHGGGHGAHGTAAASAESALQHHMPGMAHHAPAEAPHDQAPVCTCVGHCCATTATAPLSAVATIELPTLAVPHDSPSIAPADDVPAEPDHRLPFANGPPTV